MLKHRYLPYILLSLTLLLFSCDASLKDGRYVAGRFYTLIKNKNYPKIEKLIDSQALAKNDFQQWQLVFQQLNAKRGDIDTFLLYSYENFRDKDENIVLKLRYKVYYGFIPYFETLTLIKRHGSKNFKIAAYDY